VKKYIIAGLLAWLPLAITVWVVRWVINLLQGVFDVLVHGMAAILPASAHEPLHTLVEIPFVGVAILLSLLLLTGIFVTNFVGEWSLRQWNALVSRIPIVKSIYTSVKQVSDTLFSSSGQAFREAVLVPYPHADSLTIAFVTGRPSGAVAEHLDEEYVSLYVPTTPNPTSGFFLMMRRTDVIPLSMSVDEALKYIISMGVVAPVAPGGSASSLRATTRPAGL
jgi:uncharacterized membrane protein